MNLRAVLARPKEPLQVIEHAVPAPAQGEVTVRIEACGLGLHDWQVAMLDALPFVPLTLGCEAVGRREDTGQRVGITPLATSCGGCAQCDSGWNHQCAAATWHGFSRQGALCERGNFAVQHLVPLPETADAAELAVLMGTGLIAWRAAELAWVPVGERAGVFGLGGVGHLVAQLLARQDIDVYGFEPDPARAALVARREPAGPLDVALICVPSAQAIQRAFSMLRPNGRLVIAAESPTGRLDLSLHALSARGITVVGCHLAPVGVPSLLLEAYRRGEVRPRVNPRRLADAPDALYALRDGGFVGRMVFVP